MQIILALIVFIIFLAVAPRFFKWLLAVDLFIFVGGYIFLRMLALFFDASKSGRNAGMFADEVLILIFAGIGVPVIVVSGIIFGVLFSWLKNKALTNTD